MSTLPTELVTSSIRRVLRELIDGPDEAATSTWILNKEDAGLVATLDRLSPKDASAELIATRATLAGHANHIRFSLSLLNRWAKGENPFADADWAGSWRVQQVTAAEWADLRDSLRAEAAEWLDAVDDPREWDPVSLTGAIASAAHLAYHFSAIRQLLGLLEGSE
jgi:uncharacterized damage-inducible protein DinB